MAEINYNEKTIMKKGFPKIKKLGAVSPYGEATPFVWNDKLMRTEMLYIEGDNKEERPGVGIRDVETGKILSSVGEDSYFHSAYVEDGKAYIFGVDLENRGTIRVYESTDLVHWSNRVLFSNPGWVYYNTALTKGPDGYVMLMEASHPEEYVGVGFTFFFATSPDLINWTFMDYDLGFSKERYNGGPWMKYSEGYYYVISVTMLPCQRFTNYIFRTKDFKDWEVGFYNPILMPDDDDRLISPRAIDMDEAFLENMKTAFNINNSDIDMCDWNGKTYICYNTGNQLGTSGWLAEAEYDGTVVEFLKANFE